MKGKRYSTEDKIRILRDWTTAMLDKWLGNLKIKDKYIKASYKNDIRRVLVVCGGWAEKQGYLVKGCSPFPGMIRYKEEKTPVASFTPANIQAMLASADDSVKPFLAIGAFAGLRSAELERLDWSEINLERGFITVAASKAKTRCRRLVPISEDLKLWLAPLKKDLGPICLHQDPQRSAARVCDGFNLERNGLRHSYISYRELVTPEAAQVWFDVKPA